MASYSLAMMATTTPPAAHAATITTRREVLRTTRPLLSARVHPCGTERCRQHSQDENLLQPDSTMSGLFLVRMLGMQTSTRTL